MLSSESHLILPLFDHNQTMDESCLQIYQELVKCSMLKDFH